MNKMKVLFKLSGNKYEVSLLENYHIEVRLKPEARLYSVLEGCKNADEATKAWPKSIYKWERRSVKSFEKDGDIVITWDLSNLCDEMHLTRRDNISHIKIFFMEPISEKLLIGDW